VLSLAASDDYRASNADARTRQRARNRDCFADQRIHDCIFALVPDVAEGLTRDLIRS